MANIQELILGAKAGGIENFKPLPKTKTGPDADIYSKTQLTQSEFHEEYPLLPVEKIFLNDTLTQENLVYWDEKNYVLCYTHIYGGQRMALNNESNEEFSKHLLESAKKMEELRKNKEYIRFLAPFTDAVRISILNRLVEEDEPCEELCKAFVSWYKVSDYGFGELEVGKIVKLLQFLPNDFYDGSKKVLETLPDVVTVYRGEGSESTPYTKTISWTLNPNIALWYSSRLERENARLITGTCKKENILYAYDTDDVDQEIWIHPDNIEHAQVSYLYGSEVIEDCALLSYFQKYREKLLSLSFDYDSDYHTATHSARVLFLALLIADNEDEPLTSNEIRNLCMAAIYHDIGRENDETDPAHGIRSAKKYQEECSPSKVVAWMIAFHNKADEFAKEALKEITNSTKKQNSYWRLYEILKDADALDRVRFGYNNKDSLDIKMLRRPQSKYLYAVAISAFENLEL